MNVPTDLSAAVTGAFALWNPPLRDLAAHTFRADYFQHYGFALWNGSWYAPRIKRDPLRSFRYGIFLVPPLTKESTPFASLKAARSPGGAASGGSGMPGISGLDVLALVS
jgi:hypothetical protein